MAQNFSREQLNTIHLDSSHADKAYEFKDWNYRIGITFRLSRGRQVPSPTSLTIETYYKDKRLSHTIRPGQNDRRRLGELIFLLAAKLKYDLLCDIPYDGAGFLHSDEIIRLNDTGIIKVQKTTYHAIRYLLRHAVEDPSSPEGIFLRKFLIDPDQLWHLICYCGRTSGTKDFQDLIWWLNIHPEAVSFQDAKDNITDGQALKKILMKLFPAECCLTDDELKAFQENIEQYPDVKWGKAKIADSAAEHIGSESIDKTTLAPYAAGFDPELLPQIIDVLTEVERHQNFVGRQQLRDIVNSYLRKHNSGYLIVEGGVGTGKTAFVVDQVRKTIKKTVVYHLIRRNMGDWDNPDAFLLSLYAQLLKKYNLPEPEGSKDMSPIVKLNTVLVEISKQIQSEDKEIIYVDGLDEAFGETGLYTGLWPHVFPQILPQGIFFIITSRPGQHLDLFSSPETCVRIRIEDTPSQNDKDIKQYLKDRNKTFSLGLSKKFIDVAVARAAGKFMFATWLIEDMKALPPEERIVDRIPEGLIEKMKGEWARVMRALERRGLGKRRFFDIAALLVAAFEPLTAAHFDELIGIDNPWETTTELLSEFFEPQSGHSRENQCFRVWHTAFAEFIENKLGPTKMRKAHRRLAAGCAKWQDMIATPPRHYALNYWIKHLTTAREWEKTGRAFCNPSYLKKRIEQGKFDNLLADVDQCAKRPEISNQLRRSFRTLHDFLVRRSPWFHKYPESVSQELVNELQWENKEVFLNWMPGVGVIRKPWLRKISGPRNLMASGHSGNVTTIKFSPDGLRIVSGSSDQTIRIWDAKTLECLFVCTLHTGCVNSISFSPDGMRMASGSDDGTVQIRDSTTGECLTTCGGHKAKVKAVVFSHDGSKVVSTSSDDTVNNALRIWNVETGECSACCIGHSSSLIKTDFSPDGQQLVSTSWDGTMKLWDGEKCTATTRRLSEQLIAVSFSLDGRRVVSINWSGKVKVWNIDTGKFIPLHKKTSYSLWDKRSGYYLDHLSLRGIPEELWLFDGRMKDPIANWLPVLGNLKMIAFLPENRRIVLGSKEGKLQIWNANTGKCLELSDVGGPGIGNIAISPDCQRVAVGGSDGSLVVWNVETGMCIAENAGSCLDRERDWIRPTCVAAISYDGNYWVFGYDDKLTLLRRKIRQKVWNLEGPKSPLHIVTSSAVFSPDGQFLVAGYTDGTLMSWNVDTGERVATSRKHKYGVEAAVFSPDGQRIVSADFQNVHIWDTRTWECLSHWRSSPPSLNFTQAIAYSPDGLTIAAGMHNGLLMLFSAQTGQCIKSWMDHSSRLVFVRFSPDGREIITLSRKGLINIWNVENTKCLRTIRSDLGRILALDKGGRMIVVGNADGSVHFWDQKAGDVLNILFFERAPFALSFSCDDRQIFIVDGVGRFFSYQLIGF